MGYEILFPEWVCLLPSELIVPKITTKELEFVFLNFLRTFMGLGNEEIVAAMEGHVWVDSFSFLNCLPMVRLSLKINCPHRFFF